MNSVLLSVEMRVLTVVLICVAVTSSLCHGDSSSSSNSTTVYINSLNSSTTTGIESSRNTAPDTNSSFSGVVEKERNMENHPAQASTPKNRFHVSSFFNTPVASNLVNLITNAMKSRSQATAAINTTLEKQDEGSGGGDELNPATTTEENQSSNASHVGQEAFLPASPEQFGNLGTGSKFVDLLPDISEYSIETDSLAQYAGAGAMALVALGAILAVPVAPIILRRTGTSGWAGIPSWSNLLNWWSSPDPTAEAWADNYYQGYNDEYPAEAYPGGDEHYYGYDPSVSGSNVDPQVVSYHSGNTQVSGSPGKAPPAYHNTHTPTFQNNLPQSYAPNKHHPRPHRRQDNKKTQNVDGYEYVTLEQINRIGDESVKVLSELVSNYGMDDLYGFRDGSNQLQRRRLPHRQQQQQQQQEQHHQQQQQQKPSYQEHVDETYTQIYPDDAPEGHPYRGSYSMVEPEKEEANSDPHPYRSKYSFPAPAREDETPKKKEESQQVYKVSEFPYEFHK